MQPGGGSSQFARFRNPCAAAKTVPRRSRDAHVRSHQPCHARRPPCKSLPLVSVRRNEASRPENRHSLAPPISCQPTKPPQMIPGPVTSSMVLSGRTASLDVPPEANMRQRHSRRASAAALACPQPRACQPRSNHPVRAFHPSLRDPLRRLCRGREAFPGRAGSTTQAPQCLLTAQAPASEAHRSPCAAACWQQRPRLDMGGGFPSRVLRRPLGTGSYFAQSFGRTPERSGVMRCKWRRRGSEVLNAWPPWSQRQWRTRFARGVIAPIVLIYHFLRVAF
ncbi:hypothetical protein VDGL01_05909 [Verticillium dahliae]